MSTRGHWCAFPWPKVGLAEVFGWRISVANLHGAWMWLDAEHSRRGWMLNKCAACGRYRLVWIPTQTCRPCGGGSGGPA